MAMCVQLDLVKLHILSKCHIYRHTGVVIYLPTTPRPDHGSTRASNHDKRCPRAPETHRPVPEVREPPRCVGPKNDKSATQGATSNRHNCAGDSGRKSEASEFDSGQSGAIGSGPASEGKPLGSSGQKESGRVGNGWLLRVEK
ncbi:hypothetical protein B0T18DRAFT_87579 [Schizothecium vesticola]|uniref:Uncharacterized protein n=1 Tax=Schizothecium vesticola TaxID=314040 RepID=A0AA40F7A5_9PEZI|nr:hypothetical protein B0T18DRAFT_87579 [Schizothecium vesticola]